MHLARYRSRASALRELQWLLLRKMQMRTWSQLPSVPSKPKCKTSKTLRLVSRRSWVPRKNILNVHGFNEVSSSTCSALKAIVSILATSGSAALSVSWRECLLFPILCLTWPPPPWLRLSSCQVCSGLLTLFKRHGAAKNNFSRNH